MANHWKRESIERKLWYVNFNYGKEYSEEREAELNELLEDGWNIAHESFNVGHLYMRLERRVFEIAQDEDEIDGLGEN